MTRRLSAARGPRLRLEALAASDPRVAKELRDAAVEAMSRLHALILNLGRTTAEEKVGYFLLRMAERLSGGPADRMVLPMSREDIADYLALSVETVSRSLTQLKRRGVISRHEEHTPGSFVVVPAPLSALWESPRRKQGRGIAPPPATPPSLEDLDENTRVMLRNLAERALEGLGLKDTAAFLQGEMLRQFGAIAATIGDAPGREGRLRTAIRAALDQHE